MNKLASGAWFLTGIGLIYKAIIEYSSVSIFAITASFLVSFLLLVIESKDKQIESQKQAE